MTMSERTRPRRARFPDTPRVPCMAVLDRETHGVGWRRGTTSPDCMGERWRYHEFASVNPARSRSKMGAAAERRARREILCLQL